MCTVILHNICCFVLLTDIVWFCVTVQQCLWVCMKLILTLVTSSVHSSGLVLSFICAHFFQVFLSCKIITTKTPPLKWFYFPADITKYFWHPLFFYSFSISFILTIGTFSISAATFSTWWSVEAFRFPCVSWLWWISRIFLAKPKHGPLPLSHTCGKKSKLSAAYQNL